jgi:DNA-binding NtrC family response regulator
MTKIVYIDSENGVRELYSQLLEAAGYRVYQATTAQYGMWLCEECEPDLIVTTRDPVDAELEDREFIDVLRGRAGRTPVVTISHEDSIPGSVAGAGNGQTDAHRYLELMDAIHRALDDGAGKLAITNGRSAEGAASSTLP